MVFDRRGVIFGEIPKEKIGCVVHKLMNILFFYFNDNSHENLIIICAICISKWRRFNFHLNVKHLFIKKASARRPFEKVLHRQPLQMNVFENKSYILGCFMEWKVIFSQTRCGCKIAVAVGFGLLLNFVRLL